MLGLGLNIFTLAIRRYFGGGGGQFAGSSLNLDFTSGNQSLDPRITFSRASNATVTGPDGVLGYAPHNLLTFSEQFDNAVWVGSATVTSNALAAPNGTFTADYLVRASQSSDAKYQTVTSASGVCSASVYVKKDTSPNSLIWLYDATAAKERLNINLTWSGSTPIVVASVGSVAAPEDVGDGWWRITGTTTSLIQGNANRFYMLPAYIAADNGQRTAFWGAQLEQSSTATSYNPTTVKNLLGFTEHFDNAAWIKSNATISATKVDDIYGQPFAQKLVENTAADQHSARFENVFTSDGTRRTLSLYVKQGERRYLVLAATNTFNSASATAVFDTQTGTWVNAASLYTNYSSVSVGNGWWRIGFTSAVNDPSYDNFRIGLADGPASTNASYTGDGTSGIYIFGAQLSDSASVDPYVYQPVAAPTSTAYYGPRFDYDPVTLAPKGLLIEESRTNVCLYSEDFRNTAEAGSTRPWAVSSGANTVTANAGTSPANDNTASQMSFTASSFAGRGQSFTATSGVTYTWSVWIKRLSGAGNGRISFVGAITSATSFAATGDWQRISITATAASTGTATALFYPAYLATSTGDYLLWGAQLEAGSSATSYIPTVASQVTRAADSASMIQNNFARWYRQDEGTLYGETVPAISGYSPLFQIDNGTADNRILAEGGVDTHGFVRVGGATVCSIDMGETSANTLYKLAFAYKVDDFAGSLNGGTVGTDTAGALPVVTAARIGANTSQSYTQTIKRISYFNRRLANAELIGLTS